MSRRWVSGFAILLASIFLQAFPAAAGEVAPVAEPESPFSGIIQADFTNAYFFRGIKQEREGFIAQPWAELHYSAFSSETGLIRDISIGAGVWASFHTKRTGHNNHPKSLYEVDWYPVLSIGLPQGLSLTTIYYFYTSPNDAFAHTEELNFKVAWDDSELLGPCSLQPWFNVAIETHGTAFGPNKGQGFQMGIAPTLYEIPIPDYPVTVTAPVEMGLALHDYYENDSGKETPFGYISYGLSLSVPLSFVPEGAGSWNFAVTGKGMSLGNRLAAYNHGRHANPIGVASLSVEF